MRDVRGAMFRSFAAARLRMRVLRVKNLAEGLSPRLDFVSRRPHPERSEGEGPLLC